MTLAAVTSAAVTLAAVTLAAVTLAAVTLAAVTLAVVTLVAGTEKALLFHLESSLKSSFLSAEVSRRNCYQNFSQKFW